MKKVLVLGASGMLGHKAYQMLSPHFDTYPSFKNFNDPLRQLKIFTEEKIIDKVDAFNFQYVTRAIDFISGEDASNRTESKQISNIKSLSPLISVLVPTYNQAQFLPSALDSLLAQTYANWEAIIINDGSTDSTLEVMKRYAAKDPRFRIFHKENGGCGSALNEALRNARGEWICWLSSDDLFVQNKLEIHLKAIEQYPDIKFFHTDYYWLDEAIQKMSPSNINFNEFLPPPEMQIIGLFQCNYFNGISICIHRSVFEQIGFFKEYLRNAQDYDMWLRISSQYQSQFLTEKTSISRVHPNRETNIFPIAGIFDGARAGLDFLNEYPFEVLFPKLDLRQKDQIYIAIQSVISTILNTATYINRCGYSQALIDRLREWLVHYCPQDLKRPLEEEFKNIRIAVQSSSTPEEIKNALESLCGSTIIPFIYERYDPLKTMLLHAEYLEKTGNNNEACVIRQYLDRVKLFENI